MADADCLSGDTLIYYYDNFGYLRVNKIKNIKPKNIDSILSYDFVSNSFKICKITGIVNKPAKKPFIKFKNNVTGETVESYYDHGFPVYDSIDNNIKFLNGHQIIKERYWFLAPKKIKTQEKKININLLKTFINCVINTRMTNIKINHNKIIQDNKYEYGINVTISKELAFLIGLSIDNTYYFGFDYNSSSIFISYLYDIKNDSKIIELIKYCCDKLNYRYNEHIDDTSDLIVINSIQYYLILQYFNLYYSKSNIPNEFLTAFPEVKVWLLKGIFANTYFTGKSKNYSFLTSSLSKNTINSVKFLLRTMGLFCLQKRTFILSWLNVYNIQSLRDRHLVREIDKNLLAIKIDSIEINLHRDRAYCFIVDETSDFTIGNTGIVTFNCDGLHINALVVLLLHKFFPDLITEGRVSIVMPPLYGASKGKQFIPIYNVNDLEKYKNKGYTTQRFKGLGEMRSDQMRAVFDSNFEYIVQEPKQLEEDIKIITDSAEKRKYLNLTQEFNFEKFLKEIFKERGLKI